MLFKPDPSPNQAKNARSRNFDASRGLSIYDGAIMVGFVVIRGGQFDAFDAAGRKIGTFPTLKAAMRAPARAKEGSGGAS